MFHVYFNCMGLTFHAGFWTVLRPITFSKPGIENGGGHAVAIHRWKSGAPGAWKLKQFTLCTAKHRVGLRDSSTGKWCGLDLGRRPQFRVLLMGLLYNIYIYVCVCIYGLMMSNVNFDHIMRSVIGIYFCRVFSEGLPAGPARSLGGKGCRSGSRENYGRSKKNHLSINYLGSHGYGDGSKPYPPGEHQKSWDSWMFIPLKMVLV